MALSQNLTIDVGGIMCEFRQVMNTKESGIHRKYTAEDHSEYDLRISTETKGVVSRTLVAAKYTPVRNAAQSQGTKPEKVHFVFEQNVGPDGNPEALKAVYRGIAAWLSVPANLNAILNGEG